jgi:hypothetical protein
MTAELLKMITHCESEIKRLEGRIVALLMEKAGVTQAAYNTAVDMRVNELLRQSGVTVIDGEVDEKQWLDFPPTDGVTVTYDPKWVEGGKKDGE